MTHQATTRDGRTGLEPDTALEVPMLLVHAGRRGTDPGDDALQQLHDEAGHGVTYSVFAEACTHPACLTLQFLQARFEALEDEHAAFVAAHGWPRRRAVA